MSKKIFQILLKKLKLFLNSFSQQGDTSSLPSSDLDANDIISKHSSRMESRAKVKDLGDDFAKLDVKAGINKPAKKPAVKKEEDDLWEMLNN